MGVGNLWMGGGNLWMGGGNLWMGGMRESLDMEGRRESVNGISGVS